MPQKTKQKKDKHEFGDNWNATWKRIGVILNKKDFNISKFRREADICTRLHIVRDNKYGWEKFCGENNVPIEWRTDSQIGSPNNIDGTGASPDSIKWAYCLSSVLPYMPNQPATVLEVGPGFGGLAEKICKYGNVDKYYFVDHPNMYKIQRYYMKEAGFIDKCEFGLPKSVDNLDLIISTFSLSEMTTDQVATYINLFETLIAPTGTLYLIQYTKTRKKRIGWEEFPFTPGFWKLKTKLLSGIKGDLFTEIIGKPST
jgi:phospholipid N-methyltransferase